MTVRVRCAVYRWVDTNNIKDRENTEMPGSRVVTQSDEGTLLAITGRATLMRLGEEDWDGLNSANEIFSAGGVESEQSIRQKKTLTQFLAGCDCKIQSRTGPGGSERQILLDARYFYLDFWKGPYISCRALGCERKPLSHLLIFRRANKRRRSIRTISVFDKSNMNQPELNRARDLKNVQEPSIIGRGTKNIHFISRTTWKRCRCSHCRHSE
jgi:hypothetical protein